MTPTCLYTDGACSGNPGPGGWAWAVPGGGFASGAEARSTNQRMEITAAFEAVRANPGRIEVVSDSTYVVNCFRDRWHEGWRKRGWLTSARKPVVSRDLWEPFIDLVLERGDVTFRWVKGHSDDPMNDLVDRLAVEAALTQQGRSGERPPTDLGPADRPARTASAAASPDPRVPAGRKVVVFGHRPPELGGYGPNPVADRVRRQLQDVLAAKVELHPDLVVVTGLRLGAEQLAAEAATGAGLPYVAVLPHPDPDKMWPEASRRRFRALLDGARGTVQLERKVPASPQQAGAALARRDAWLARAADEAVLVWDRQDPALGKLARSLADHLGDDVWFLEP
ncbi:hypothetical protein BH20ACT2_BH20ACT2_19440 [soil metagenome]